MKKTEHPINGNILTLQMSISKSIANKNMIK